MSYPKSRTENTVDRNCKFCDKTFCVFKSQPQEFCSRQCRDTHRRIPFQDRFWKYVWKTDTCWLWIGAYRGAYGTISKQGGKRSTFSHRASWTINVGPIPNRLNVLHRCDNPSCVRPDHLFLGTSADNTADMIAKDRQCRGERSHTAKLTSQQVIEIRNSGLTQRQIVERYGIVQSVASAILLRKSWKHI